MEWLIFFADYPYLGVCVIFLLCGIGLPIPDEVVLVYAGYQVFLAPDEDLWLLAVSAGCALVAALVLLARTRHLIFPLWRPDDTRSN